MDTKILISLLLVLLVSGCADSLTLQQAIAVESVGFWYGWWHGFTLPFSFIGQLIWDDISIYAIYNNGGWYDFGFWLGLSSYTFRVRLY